MVFYANFFGLLVIRSFVSIPNNTTLLCSCTVSGLQTDFVQCLLRLLEMDEQCLFLHTLMCLTVVLCVRGVCCLCARERFGECMQCVCTQEQKPLQMYFIAM